jgi:hypothetical protein
MGRKRRRVVLRHPITGMAEIHATRLTDKQLGEWTEARRLGCTSHPDRAPDSFEDGFFVWTFASGEARPITPEGLAFAVGRRYGLPDGRVVDLLAFYGPDVDLLVERWRCRGGRVRDEETTVRDAATELAYRQEVLGTLKFVDAGAVRPDASHGSPSPNLSTIRNRAVRSAQLHSPCRLRAESPESDCQRGWRGNDNAHQRYRSSRLSRCGDC